MLEAFHCAAYSRILNRHGPAAFQDKALQKLMISTILLDTGRWHSKAKHSKTEDQHLATETGADYMQQLGLLPEKIQESKVTDGWAHQDAEWARGGIGLGSVNTMVCKSSSMECK